MVNAVMLLLTNLAFYSMENITHNDPPITVIETGVIEAYDATKVMYCDGIEWHVKWEVVRIEKEVSGEILIKNRKSQKILENSDEKIFSRFSYVDNVSASCQPSIADVPARSTLYISGVRKQDSKLIQLRLYINSRLEVGEIRVILR